MVNRRNEGLGGRPVGSDQNNPSHSRSGNPEHLNQLRGRYEQAAQWQRDSNAQDQERMLNWTTNNNIQGGPRDRILKRKPSSELLSSDPKTRTIERANSVVVSNRILTQDNSMQGVVHNSSHNSQ